MSDYDLHPEAFADIDEIAVYIGEDSPEAALDNCCYGRPPQSPRYGCDPQRPGIAVWQPIVVAGQGMKLAPPFSCSRTQPW